MTLLLAIDPGAKGALVALDRFGLLEVTDMPDTIAGIVAAVLRYDIRQAVIERAQSMPHQGVASSFRYGVHYGAILGILAALQVPVDTVPPGTWKRSLGLNADKNAARRRACELWPDHAHLFARVKDDGRAEAALIGHWWLTTRERTR